MPQFGCFKRASLPKGGCGAVFATEITIKHLWLDTSKSLDMFKCLGSKLLMLAHQYPGHFMLLVILQNDCIRIT